jgi:hypothetical protein
MLGLRDRRSLITGCCVAVNTYTGTCSTLYGKVGQLGSKFKNSTLVHLYLLLLQHSLLQELCRERTTILL